MRKQTDKEGDWWNAGINSYRLREEVDEKETHVSHELPGRPSLYSMIKAGHTLCDFIYVVKNGLKSYGLCTAYTVQGIIHSQTAI